MFVGVQNAELDHVGVMRVFFSIFRQVQSNVVPVIPGWQQALFQQVSLARALHSGGDQQLWGGFSSFADEERREDLVERLDHVV
ncbi:hypothetical protein D3C79_891750 [compost metagenome]